MPRDRSCDCGTCATCRERDRVLAWKRANAERNRQQTAEARQRAKLAAARRAADADNADDGVRLTWTEWKRRYGHRGGAS